MNDNQELLDPPPKPPWWMFVTVMAFALVVRGGVLLALRDNLKEDRDLYRDIAENLAGHGTFARTVDGPQAPERQPVPTAFRPPLYPLLLSTVASDRKVTEFSAGMLHLLLGLATVALTYRLGIVWRLQNWTVLAAGLVACEPVLLYWSTFVMTETLATFLAVASLYCLTRFSKQPNPWNGGLAGGSIALATLCRPTFGPWLILTAFAVLFVKASWTKRVANVVVMLVVATVVFAPWTIRNYGAFGRPIVLTTHGGYTFLLGNNSHFYEYLRTGEWGTAWEPESFFKAWEQRVAAGGVRASGDELAESRLAYEFASESVSDEPLMFVFASAVRVGHLWSPLPHQLSPDESIARRLLRYATAVFSGVVFVLAIAGLWNLKGKLARSPWGWGLLLCLVFTAVHAFYWSNIRMRAPLMPFVCLLAAAGAARIAASMQRRKSKRDSRLRDAD